MKNTFQSITLDDCFVKKNRIDIWQYPLTNEFDEAASFLSDDELIRARNYYFPKHQRRFAVARAKLRLILARYLQLPANQLSFELNPYGKPQLCNDPSVQFNVSHSKDLALLAIGSHYPLGIDLEFFSARPYEGIANHMFSSIENNALANVETALKPLCFFHIWAQKEAFIKACGLGLSYPTKEFDVPALPPTSQKVLDLKHHQTWHIRSFQPQMACCAALCHHPSVTTIRYMTTNNVHTIQELL
jgi:4'-phosphopantetheinyl transferase